jgi:putative copper resistance protein D
VNVSGAFLLLVLWLHMLSATAWVGGSIFYLLVLRPTIRRVQPSSIFTAEAAREFRNLVGLCIVFLIITGVILTFDRLTSPYTDGRYVAILTIKITLALIMFTLARSRRARYRQMKPSKGEQRSLSAVFRRSCQAISVGTTILIIGGIVLLLADVLRIIYEVNLGKGN